MRSILESCQPREDLRAGTFNPEVFTASLSQVVDYYRDPGSVSRSLYTDAEAFFREATYPTDGLRMVLTDVFTRLSGDPSAPSIHRLETAFGGGKTHALIALTHLAHRGKELAAVTADLLAPALLPDPGTVRLVGVAGDDLPVHKPQGTALTPYTLWGEIAFQVGGEPLYREVEAEVTSYAAPGKSYFERVFGGRKALLLLDELAQYAARLEAARAEGAEQLAAFLMGLNGYARTHAGLAVVLTLAGERDAFTRQTGQLMKLLAKVTGEKVTEDKAVGIAQRAEAGIRSVVARDAVTVVPVASAEISRVLAKRLFESIDPAAARETADAYLDLYRKSATSLPERAARDDFRHAMEAHYPFHPTAIDFLTQKLATVETFQGTRGVLRVLALAVRSLWNKKQAIPMVHTCHLDLRDARTVNEILGRTGGGELLPVLNTDVGGADTGTLAAGKSRAELADQRNPHPAGLPLHEYTWKTVFLHSLVGRSDGVGSPIFGITEKEALFDVAFPGLPPTQVEMALRLIEDDANGAYYLRFRQGKYFAGLEPTLTRILADIREGLRPSAVTEELGAAARKVVGKGADPFQVHHDVADPGHLPEGTDRPQLAVVSLEADKIDPEAFVTTLGENRPRQRQNLVFLLVPELVLVTGQTWNEDRVQRMRATRNRLEDMARDVIARRKLREKPENFGVTKATLTDQEFERRSRERENALITAVSQAYNAVWFPSASGQIVAKEIKATGGESGLSVATEIRRVLVEAGELLTQDNATTRETLLGLSELFFGLGQTPSLAKLRESFACVRRWPVLDRAGLLEQMVRAGVSHGYWCLFRMGDQESARPDAIYAREGDEPPLTLDFGQAGWSLVTMPGAKKRGWLASSQVDPARVEAWVAEAVAETPAAYVSAIVTKVKEAHGEVPDSVIYTAVDNRVRNDHLATYGGTPEQEQKPSDLVRGPSAILHAVKPDDVVVTPAEAAKRGWIEAADHRLSLSGKKTLALLTGLLPRLGGMYARGATTTIGTLDLVDLEVQGGGRLRLSLEKVPPEGMKRLGELFEVLDTVVTAGSASDAYLEVDKPDENCPLVQALKKGK
ncbi:MAG: ATP-binding protein [Deferrisomatales bacterium]